MDEVGLLWIEKGMVLLMSKLVEQCQLIDRIITIKFQLPGRIIAPEYSQSAYSVCVYRILY